MRSVKKKGLALIASLLYAAVVHSLKCSPPIRAPVPLDSSSAGSAPGSGSELTALGRSLSRDDMCGALQRGSLGPRTREDLELYLPFPFLS
ncbi:hypothetical protein AAFF_G00208760 [Aldrovandia affinis]|uniref:Secreted protein n=1 Tax=Aldrovandia affinis TaxID=143900 RepID=A0AAD7RHD5_9TELE|nr:hypothetical protein AAFF_G00208760 [Aldrovandia affinis]